jgi:hypothetical protein
MIDLNWVLTPNEQKVARRLEEAAIPTVDKSRRSSCPSSHPKLPRQYRKGAV